MFFSKVKNLRDELLENCKYAIDRLEAANHIVSNFTSNNKRIPEKEPVELETADPPGGVCN